MEWIQAVLHEAETRMEKAGVSSSTVLQRRGQHKWAGKTAAEWMPRVVARCNRGLEASTAMVNHANKNTSDERVTSIRETETAKFRRCFGHDSLEANVPIPLFFRSWLKWK